MSMPPMYPYHMGYGGYPPTMPYPPSYPGMSYEHTPGTSMSDLKPLSFDEGESDEDQSIVEERLKYTMGPLLENVIEDFHKGDKILKEDRKSKTSLLNLTSKSKSKHPKN